MMYSGHCPHCGSTVRGGHGSPVKRIGSPIMTCPNCKKHYIDENMYEWAVIANECKLQFYFFDNNRWFIPFFALFVGFASESWLLGVLFLLAAYGICALLVHFYNSEQINESTKRCSDTCYVDRLAEINYSLLDQRFTDEYHARKKQSVVTPPAEPPREAVKQDTQDISAPFSMARFMWLQTQAFEKYTHLNLGFHQQAYIWTAYLYVIAKTFQNQALVDAIYSNFQKSIESAYGARIHGADPVIAMRSSYRGFRSILNGSMIDPRSYAGVNALWYLLSQRISPGNELSEKAGDYFKTSCRSIVSFAQKKVSNSEGSFISDMDLECELPDIQQ